MMMMKMMMRIMRMGVGEWEDGDMWRVWFASGCVSLGMAVHCIAMPRREPVRILSSLPLLVVLTC